MVFRNNKLVVVGCIFALFLSGCINLWSYQPIRTDDSKTNKNLPDVFKARRQLMMEKMDGGIAIFPGKVQNEYRQVDGKQAKYFYYLTGIEAEGGICLLDPKSREPYKLIVPAYNTMALIWTGQTNGKDVAKTKYGADAAYLMKDFDKTFRKSLRGKKKIFLNIGNHWLMKKLLPFIRGNNDLEIVNARTFLDEMRVIKDEYELKQLRKAVNITVEALDEVYRFARPGVRENQAEAVIEYIFRALGSQKPGFPSIVGAGSRTTILHYEDNNQLSQKGDLLLMDVGAEVNGYTADITRTIPINGKFSKLQKQIYNLVLKAQKEGIKAMLPGRGFLEAHNIASEIIMKGLFEIGLVTDLKSFWQKALFILYKNSHYIGLDVHDVGRFIGNGKKGRILESGMVLTMEPGVYIHPQMLSTLHQRFGRFAKKEELDLFIKKIGPIFEKYKGIGVRIEDDILITDKGQEILSKSITKEIKGIETLMKKRSFFKIK